MTMWAFGMTGGLGMTLPPCHSEARPPKNLKSLHTDWGVGAKVRPQRDTLDSSLRFGMTGGGVQNDGGRSE